MARAKKSLGQNFLVDQNIQRKIVEAIDPRTNDEVLEIGPGRGALTRLLAGRVRLLVAVELDRDLASELRGALQVRGEEALERMVHRGERGGRGEGTTDSEGERRGVGVEVVHGDALVFDAASWFEDIGRVKVIGNIPSNITSPLIFRLLERERRPADIVLMVQKEVADRIVAAPGSKDYGALTVGVQSVARVERLFHVGRQAFRPVPNVDSTVVRITPIRPFPLSEQDEQDLRTLTQVAFQWRRKQLQKTLRASPSYELPPDQVEHVRQTTGFDLERRPETFAPDELLRLARALPRQPPPEKDKRVPNRRG